MHQYWTNYDASILLMRDHHIMKTLGLSKLIFNTSVLSLPDRFAKKVDAITFDFLWDGKPHKIK